MHELFAHSEGRPYQVSPSGQKKEIERNINTFYYINYHRTPAVHVADDLLEIDSIS